MTKRRKKRKEIQKKSQELPLKIREKVYVVPFPDFNKAACGLWSGGEGENPFFDLSVSMRDLARGGVATHYPHMYTRQAGRQGIFLLIGESTFFVTQVPSRISKRPPASRPDPMHGQKPFFKESC